MQLKATLLALALASGITISAKAGDLWEWAPGHYSYSGNNGYHSDGWQWAPGHTTWTDNQGGRRDVWEWAPGHYSIQDQQGYRR
jgi:hypothetical protein